MTRIREGRGRKKFRKVGRMTGIGEGRNLGK